MAVNYGLLLNQPNPGEQMQEGILRGLQLSAMQSQADQQRIAQEQAAAQAQRNAAFQQAFGRAWQSGDKQAITQLIGQFPEQFDQIKQAAGFRDEQQTKALGSLGIQLTAAMQSGNPQAAAQMIAANAGVLRSAGPGYEPEALLERLQKDPEGFARQADLFSLAALGPEQYYKVQGQRADNELQRRGQDVQIRGQDIQMAEGAANRANAMSIKQLDLQSRDLDRQVSMIGKQLEQETNALRRDELKLKLQEGQAKLQQATQERETAKANAVSNMQEARDLAEQIKNSPQLADITGTVASRLWTVSGDSQDLINQANRLQSILTVDNLKLMTGVLTDKDIQFLTNVASGLNIGENGIRGSTKGVQQRLQEIVTKLDSKIPKATGRDPDVPRLQAAGAAADLDALLNKYAPR